MNRVSDAERSRIWMTFLLYAGLIIYLSHQPGNPNAVLPFPHFDKLIHFIEYGVFGIFFARAIATVTDKKIPIIVLGGSLLFAISDEYHQSFVPFRYPDVWDVVYDMLGVGCASGLHSLTRRRPTSNE